MQELSLNFPTVVILLVILALAVLAIRRMTRRGLCDCGDHCGDGEGGCAGCSHCASAVRPTVSSRINGTGAGDEMPPCCQAAEAMAQAAAKRGGSGPAPSVTVWRRQCERGSEVSAPSLFFFARRAMMI